MNMEFSKRTLVALKAAEVAAKVIKRAEGNISPDLIRTKGINDFVTDVDEKAEEAIVQTIKGMFAEDAILAEERGTLKGNEHSGVCWYIDPLDGTTNFIHGVPVYCISIAYEIDGVLWGGVVHDPNFREVFVAEKGKGAYLNGERIQVTRNDLPGDCLLTTGFPFRSFRFLQSYFQLFAHIIPSIHGLRRPGSAALDLCWTACGRFDGFLELNLCPWDIAAGTVIVREAGGRVTDWKGKEGFMKTGHIVATNGLIHDWLLEQIGHYFPEQELL